MTSLAYIFTMEEALVKIILGCEFAICQPIFKIFVALFTTFWMQKDGKITFCWRCFRKGIADMLFVRYQTFSLPGHLSGTDV